MVELLSKELLSIILIKSFLCFSSQIFDCPRLKFSEIPQRLTNLLLPPDPIVINHMIRFGCLIMWFCYLHARLYKCVIFIADIYQNTVFFLLNTSRQRFGVSHLNINEEINILFSKDIKTVNTFIILENIYIK